VGAKEGGESGGELRDMDGIRLVQTSLEDGKKSNEKKVVWEDIEGHLGWERIKGEEGREEGGMVGGR